jgi:hypothetical protein
MPVQVETFDAAQNAVGILFGGDVAEREAVGREQIGRRHVGSEGGDDIAGAARLQREKIVGFDEAAVGHLHRRMVGPPFAEQHVEGYDFGTLRGQFLDEPSVNVARPIKAVRFAKQAVPERGDAGIFHRDESEVGRRGRRKLLGGPDAKIVGHQLQPIRKIGMSQADAANQGKDDERENDGRAFGSLELHAVGLNEKPAQLKAALVFEMALNKISAGAAGN